MADPRFIVAQLGAGMHYAVPRILHQAGLQCWGPVLWAAAEKIA